MALVESGKMIKTKIAKMIIDDFEKIEVANQDEVLDELKKKGKPNKTIQFYSSKARAFIFDIELIRKYLKEVESAASHIVLLHAFQDTKKTMVFTAASFDGKDNYKVLANNADEVPEHPTNDGKITTSSEKFHGFDQLIFTVTE